MRENFKKMDSNPFINKALYKVFTFERAAYQQFVNIETERFSFGGIHGFVGYDFCSYHIKYEARQTDRCFEVIWQRS